MLIKGGVRVAMVSLYPFEKGFFENGRLKGPLAAIIANFITQIGFGRIRHLQKQMDYFQELAGEMDFLLRVDQSFEHNGLSYNAAWAENWTKAQEILAKPNSLALIPTIEGAHVFNSGLGKFGKNPDREEILKNIRTVKSWKFPALFITFAHNFNNDLCGHVRSLEKAGKLLDQSEGINLGFSELGWEVLEHLTSTQFGRPILIDVKHMSVESRKEFYAWNNRRLFPLPILASHAGVAGLDFSKKSKNTNTPSWLCQDEINFFDEDILEIGKTKGILALQLDSSRLANAAKIKKNLMGKNREKAIAESCQILWANIQHAAEILDQNGLDAWDSIAIGSDFDGTINPLEGIYTTLDFPDMANALLELAKNYHKNSSLISPKNRQIEPEAIISKILFENGGNFLQRNF
jgi:microsomal dipeptidase-like Zn-dependent dipeptidase